MPRKPDLKKIESAKDKIRAAAEEMVKSPLWFIEQILVKHETAVMEVMREQQAEIKSLRTAAKLGLNALCMPCDRCNKAQTEKVNEAIAALREVLKGEKE